MCRSAPLGWRALLPRGVSASTKQFSLAAGLDRAISNRVVAAAFGSAQANGAAGGRILNSAQSFSIVPRAGAEGSFLQKWMNGVCSMELESLKQLENKINKILEKHEEMRREKEALAQKLKEKEQQAAQLAGQLKQHEQERREIRTRLEKLLARLNGLDLP